MAHPFAVACPPASVYEEPGVQSMAPSPQISKSLQRLEAESAFLELIVSM